MVVIICSTRLKSEISYATNKEKTRFRGLDTQRCCGSKTLFQLSNKWGRIKSIEGVTGRLRENYWTNNTGIAEQSQRVTRVNL